MRFAAKLRSGASLASASSRAPRRAWKNRVRRARRSRAKSVSSQPSAVVTRSNRRFASGETVLAQADREWDIVIVEGFQPLGADELAIRQQDPDRRRREIREIACHQRDPGRGRAVARPVEQGPEQRNPEAPGDHREHEVVHVARPDLPGRPIERERPRALWSDQARDDRRRPVRTEIDVLEEPLQPAVGRCDLHAACARAGDVAEVDRARADHAYDEHAERFQAALAEADMAS